MFPVTMSIEARLHSFAARSIPCCSPDILNGKQSQRHPGNMAA